MGYELKSSEQYELHYRDFLQYLLLVDFVITRIDDAESVWVLALRCADRSPQDAFSSASSITDR